MRKLCYFLIAFFATTLAAAKPPATPSVTKQTAAVVAANPNHAEAHYQLGMALVNEGNLAGAATEFETYLKIAPAGPNAAQAKALVAQLKK